jgi:hypothetical protein
VGANEETDRHERVDVHDAKSVTTFSQGCDVVVNCLDLDVPTLRALATTVINAGTNFVDASGGIDHATLPTIAANQIVVLAAEAIQGCASLLSRHLLALPEASADNITVHSGGLFRPSLATAAQIANQFAATHPLASWRGGWPTCGVAAGPANSFFPPTAVAVPLLSPESQRLAERHQLDNGSWSIMFDGRSVALALRDGTLTADGLIDACERDIAMSRPYLMVVARTETNRATHRTAILRLHDPSSITASLTASTVHRMQMGRLSAGVHYASELLEPTRTLAELTLEPRVAMLTFISHPYTQPRIDEVSAPKHARLAYR